MNYENYDLEDLYRTRRHLEDKIENFFGGGEVYHGDRGYQDLLSDLDDIEEQIEELEKD